MSKILVVKHQNLLGTERAQGDCRKRHQEGCSRWEAPTPGHAHKRSWMGNKWECGALHSATKLWLCAVTPGSIGKRWRAQGWLFTMPLHNRVLICLLAAKKCREVSLFIHNRKGFQRIWDAKFETWIAVKNIAHIIKGHKSLSWAKMCTISYAGIKFRLPKTQNNIQKACSHFQLRNSFTAMTPEMLAMLLNRKEELTISNTL